MTTWPCRWRDRSPGSWRPGASTSRARGRWCSASRSRRTVPTCATPRSWTWCASCRNRGRRWTSTIRGPTLPSAVTSTGCSRCGPSSALATMWRSWPWRTGSAGSSACAACAGSARRSTCCTTSSTSSPPLRSTAAYENPRYRRRRLHRLAHGRAAAGARSRGGGPRQPERVLRRHAQAGAPRAPHDAGAILLHEAKLRLRREAREARLLERDVVVLVEVVEAHHLVTARQQALGRVRADESGGAGDEDFHRRPSTAAAEKTCLMSYSTCFVLQSLRTPRAPSSRNCRCATATIATS